MIGAERPRRRYEDEETAMSLRRYGGTDDAPEFPRGLDWINVESPLAMSELRGRIVLLDFWTYC